MSSCSVPIGATLCLSALAAFGAGTGPPRASGNPGNATDYCYCLYSRASEVTREADLTVSVNASGCVTGTTSAPG